MIRTTNSRQCGGGLLLPGGRLVIAEFAARLRYYDREGNHLRTLNLSGNGPGEAELFSTLNRYRGDSLIMQTLLSLGPVGRGLTGTSIWARFLILDREAKFGRNLSVSYSTSEARSDSVVAPLFMNGNVQAALEDGSFIVVGGDRVVLRGNHGDILPRMAPLLHYSAEGTLLDSIGVIRTGAIEYRPATSRRWEQLMQEGGQVPLQGGGEGFFHAFASEFRVDEYARGSSADSTMPIRLFRSIRVKAPLVPSTSATLERYAVQSAKFDGLSGEAADDAIRRTLQSSRNTPPFLPALQALQVDQPGNLWLEPYTSPGVQMREMARNRGIDIEDGPSRWVVLTPEGELLTSVLVPKGMRILDIGERELIALTRDSLGVHYVQLHEIHKRR